MVFNHNFSSSIINSTIFSSWDSGSKFLLNPNTEAWVSFTTNCIQIYVLSKVLSCRWNTSISLKQESRDAACREKIMIRPTEKAGSSPNDHKLTWPSFLRLIAKFLWPLFIKRSDIDCSKLLSLWLSKCQIGWTCMLLVNVFLNH